MVMASMKMRLDGIPTLGSKIPRLKVGSLTLKLFSADGFIFDEWWEFEWNLCRTYMMRTSLLCIQCKDQSLEHMRGSWISRYVLTLSIVFQNLRLVPCMCYWLGIMERTRKDLEKSKDSRRRS
jgi:hypothetical protein